MKNKLKNLLRRYWLFRTINQYLRKGIVGNLTYLTNEIKDCYIKIQLYVLPRSKIERVLGELSNKNYIDVPLISITFGSRRFGNPDNEILRLLTSFIVYTNNHNIVEFLIKKGLNNSSQINEAEVEEADNYLYNDFYEKSFDTFKSDQSKTEKKIKKSVHFLQTTETVPAREVEDDVKLGKMKPKALPRSKAYVLHGCKSEVVKLRLDKFGMKKIVNKIKKLFDEAIKVK